MLVQTMSTLPRTVGLPSIQIGSSTFGGLFQGQPPPGPRRLVEDVFGDCSALRLLTVTFGGNIIETGTDSYRLATIRARAKQQLATI